MRILWERASIRLHKIWPVCNIQAPPIQFFDHWLPCSKPLHSRILPTVTEMSGCIDHAFSTHVVSNTKSIVIKIMKWGHFDTFPQIFCFEIHQRIIHDYGYCLPSQGIYCLLVLIYLYFTDIAIHLPWTAGLNCLWQRRNLQKWSQGEWLKQLRTLHLSPSQDTSHHKSLRPQSPFLKGAWLFGALQRPIIKLTIKNTIQSTSISLMTDCNVGQKCSIFSPR